MNAAIAIAKHLKVNHWAVTRVEEWAKVFFAVVKGLGARLVSKKVVKMKTIKMTFKGNSVQVPVEPGVHKIDCDWAMLGKFIWVAHDGEKLVYMRTEPKTNDLKKLAVARMGKPIVDGVCVVL